MQPEQTEEQKKVDYETQLALHQLQQEDIRQEIIADSPLIGEPFHISLMLDQFLNNQGFYIKVQALHEHYQSYRKIRRDGACFYRALAFSIFEAIYVRHDDPLQKLMKEKMKGAKEFLLRANFSGMIFEDIQQMFIERLDDYKIHGIHDIVSLFCDPDISNYLILMLRFLTSGELKNNPALYETFIENDIPVEMYCQLEVEPMDKEADQISIMALLNYLQVGIKIVYLDSNVESKEAYTVVLPQNTPQKQIKATLLYRPGHYDILYK